MSLSIIDGATNEAITESAKLTVVGSDGSTVEGTSTTGTFTRQLLLKRLIELARTAANDTTTRDYTFESGTGVDRYTYLIQVDGKVPIYKNSDLLKPYTAIESMVDDTERTELDATIVDAYTITENTAKAYDYGARKRFLTPSDSFSRPYFSKSGSVLSSQYSIRLDASDSGVQTLVSNNTVLMAVGTAFTGDLTTTTTDTTPTINSMGARINLGSLRVVGIVRAEFITDPRILTTRPTLENRNSSSSLDDWDGELQVSVASGQTRYIVIRNLIGSKDRSIRVIGGGTLQVLGTTIGSIQSSAGITAYGTVTYEPLPVAQPIELVLTGVPSTVNLRAYDYTSDSIVKHTSSNSLFSTKDAETISTSRGLIYRSPIPSGNADTYEGREIAGLGSTINRLLFVGSCPIHRTFIGFIMFQLEHPYKEAHK